MFHGDPNIANPRPLRRIVIKEELVALTGCYKQAVILNQLMYWSERVRDFDNLIAEEQARDPEAAALEFRHGWIYKTSDELAQETLLGLSRSNMRTHLKRLVEAGYIHERRNPRVKLDRTLQYRVDFWLVRKGLLNIGYDLHGYVFDDLPMLPDPEPPTKEPAKREVDEVPPRDKSVSKLQNETSGRGSKQQYHRLLDIDLKDVCMYDARPRNKTSVKKENDTEVLAALSKHLPIVHVAGEVTLYDVYYDAIYSMLNRAYTGLVEPAVIAIACRIYAERQIDQPGLIVRNPVGFFHDAYGEAITQWKAIRYRKGRYVA